MDWFNKVAEMSRWLTVNFNEIPQGVKLSWESIYTTLSMVADSHLKCPSFISTLHSNYDINKWGGGGMEGVMDGDWVGGIL